MKKTLITAALAFGLAAVASAATVITATPTASGVTATATNVRGWTMDFSADAATYSEDVSAEDILYLTSIALNTTSDLTDVRLAVYLVDDVPATSWSSTYNPNNFKSIVGISEVGTSEGFSFETPLEISTEGWYSFMLVGTSSTVDSLNTGNLSQTAFNAGSGTKSLSSYATGSGIAWASMLNKGGKYNGWNYSQTVNATYNFAPVPEPATASLSLLGLAALAMRRRRA